jgi:hypothetical protein
MHPTSEDRRTAHTDMSLSILGAVTQYLLFEDGLGLRASFLERTFI